MPLRILLTLIVLLASLSPVFAAFRAGIATRVVTPDPLLPVSGGVGASKPVREKQGDLTVRALVFDDGATRVAIVSGDFLGFPAVLGNRVRAAVKSVPPQNILIGATHTHSAPDCYGFPDGVGGTSYDAKYVQHVCAQMVAAISEAVEKLRPASLKIATGEAKGKIAYNYYAEQLYDPRCHVIQAIGDDGRPFATLVNYAIHPEVIGSNAGILSPDLVGPLYDRLAAADGGTGIFMNSAQGGMVTADNRTGERQEARTYAECIRIGTLLADEALRLVQAAPVQSAPKLFCAAKALTFPVDSPLMRQLLATLPGAERQSTGDDSVTTQCNVINIGNAQILTIPGEALPNIGFYLKRKMRGAHNLLFGLTNDAFGYILSKEDFGSFKRYDYVSRTSLGERTGEILVTEALQFIARCPAPEKLPGN